MNNEGQTNKKQKTADKVSTLAGVVTSCAGNRMQPVYKRVFDEKTKLNLVKKVDEFDIYEFIQASKSQTDLALLQKRYLELGEIPQVNPELGSHDLTNMPTNIHEVYDLANDIATNFGKLPDSIQKIFGTKEAYMRSLMDGSYQATILNAVKNLKKPDVEPAKAEEGK